MIFSSSFGVLTLQYVPAVPQPDAKDRLSDDARVVSNRRRYLLEVDLRISNHSERPFCAPNLTFVPPIQHFQARRGGPTQGEFPGRPLRRAPAKPPAQPVGMAESKRKRTSWQKPACTHSAHSLAKLKKPAGVAGGAGLPGTVSSARGRSGRPPADLSRRSDAA